MARRIGLVAVLATIAVAVLLQGGRALRADDPSTMRLVVVENAVIASEFVTPPVDVRGWKRITWQVTVLEGNEGFIEYLNPMARIYSQQPLQRLASPDVYLTNRSDSDTTLGVIGENRVFRCETFGTEMGLRIYPTQGQSPTVAVTALLER